MGNIEPENNDPRVFRASALLTFSIWMATFAGIGGVIPISIGLGKKFLGTEGLGIKFLLIGLELMLPLAIVYFFPGNGIASYPHEIRIEPGKGLRLFAPFKQIYIPIKDVKDVRHVFLGNFVVRLNHRHRLLTEFIIPWSFGGGRSVADAISAEIHHRDQKVAF